MRMSRPTSVCLRLNLPISVIDRRKNDPVGIEAGNQGRQREVRVARRPGPIPAAYTPDGYT